MRNSNEESLSDILKKLSGSKVLKLKLTEVRIKESWSKSLGPSIEHYTDKLYYKNGVLNVYLSSDVLRQELMYDKTKILQRLNEELQEDLVKDIVFK